MSYINTVLGPIHPNELGVTMDHDHIIWGPPGWEYDPDWWFNYPKVFAKCLADFIEYRQLGGKSMVDCSGIGFGRDIELYRMVSKYSGVHVIPCTGFWTGLGMSGYFLEKDIDYMEELFVQELTHGIGNTGVKAGIIKVGNSQTMFTDWEERQYRAAARAAKRVGCAVITHGVQLAIKQLEIFQSEKLDLSHVIVSHCYHSIDFERDKKIAGKGAWVSYDAWGILDVSVPNYYARPDEVRADILKALIEAGFINHILISADTNVFSLGWQRSSPYSGKSTMADVLRNAPRKLRRIGISEDIVWNKIMTENPRRALTIQ